MCVHAHSFSGPQKAQKRVSYLPVVGVTGNYELPDVGARNETQTLCKSSIVLLTIEPSLPPYVN